MRYELIPNSNEGIIVDNMPVLQDIKGTFEVSFVLPFDGAYIALFRGENGVEYKAVIKNGAVLIPKELIGKEQRVGLTVCLIDEETILHSWECHALKIGAFLHLRQTQWQITAGLDDREMYARLAEIEKAHAKTQADFNTQKAENSRLADELAKTAQEYAESVKGLTKALASVKMANETLAGAYNEAIKVVNDLSARVTALEKNYDPTIIK